MRRPMSHICSLSLNSGMRVWPLLLAFPFAPYAIVTPSDSMTHDRHVEDGGVVGVERDALLGVERHARLAALREGDRVAVAGAEVVVDDDRFLRPSRFARECEAVLHLDDEEPPAHERVVGLSEAD